MAIEVTMSIQQQLTIIYPTTSPNRIRVTANIEIAKRLYEIDNRTPVSKSERSCDNRNVKKTLFRTDNLFTNYKRTMILR